MIETLLKQIHTLKKVRSKEYGFFQNNDANILKSIEKYENKYNVQPTALKISKELNITQATITPMIERLVKKNYLQRKVSPTDKRAKLLFITDEGSELIKKSREEERRQAEKLALYLGDEDTQESIRLLQKIIRYTMKEKEDDIVT